MDTDALGFFLSGLQPLCFDNTFVRPHVRVLFARSTSPSVAAGRAADNAFEDAVELRVAAEAGFERSVEHREALASAVELQKFFDALAVAEIHECDAGLLLEQTAQARRAQAGSAREFVQARRGGFVADQARGAFDGGMNVAHGDIGGVFEILPGIEQRVAQAGIEVAGTFARGGDFGEQVFESREVALWQSPTVFTGGICLTQNFCVRVGGNSPHGLGFEDADPHFEIGCLFNEDVFLRRKKPEQIATANLVFAIGQQVEARALGDEVEFQFGVAVHGIAPVVAVMPKVSVPFRRQVEALAHSDKKR